MKRLEGKKVLVTGAGIGIGFGIATLLAEEGAQVVFHCHNSILGAQKGVNRINAQGGMAHIVQGDLSTEQACFDLVNKSHELMGGIDVLVNNSGISKSVKFTEASLNDLQLLYGVNFRSYFLCTQQAVRLMPETGGVVINISSVHGFGGVPGNSIYASMKGAINALTRQLAVELAERNIRVNAVAPGHIEVERHFTYANYSTEGSASRVPLGRVGRPEDISKLVAFLASEDGSFITGQIIYSDGGLTAGLNLPTREK